MIQKTHGSLADVEVCFGDFVEIFGIVFSEGSTPAIGGVLTFIRRRESVNHTDYKFSCVAKQVEQGRCLSVELDAGEENASTQCLVVN
eukprot:10152761-Karenia_brevis.AAC.1